MIQTPQAIITEAIETWRPVAVVSLFSGGYDSMVMTHMVQSLDTHGVPLSAWSIDTKLSADGWRDFVTASATELGFNEFSIYDNQSGYNEFVQWVTERGCPRNRVAHTRCYARLKERGINAILMEYKQKRSDKVLFLSGIRKHESLERSKLTEPIQRNGHKNSIFANPLFYWRDEDIARYRIEHDLPDNPFYSTVKGSGDCQCNWGNFITLGTLQRYSPKLAEGNVGSLDTISREKHGYGWDGTPAAQLSLFDDEELTTPFLCANCSRTNKVEAIEHVMLQRGF